MTSHHSIYIGGSWVAPGSSTTIDVLDSCTLESMGCVPACTAADVDDAVAAAGNAFPSWSSTPVAQRAGYMVRISEGLAARTDELAEIMTRETGMALKMSRLIQVGSPVHTFALAAECAQAYAFEVREANSIIVREPVGVVGCITPWNYPLHQIASKVAYAMAAGCTVVLKPSQVAPLDAFVLAEVIDSIGLPDGVFNLVSGTGAEVGEAIALHPDVDMVSFTGSTGAGRRVAAICAASIKRLTLELGGKSANVILEDVDEATFSKAVASGVGKAFLNSGQTCSALSRMLIPRSRLGEAETIAARAADSLVVGDPFEPATRLGPLATAAQRDIVQQYIQAGISEGATLVSGGLGPPDGHELGYYVRPTVFSDVTPEMTIATEEIFGPVLSIMPYEDDDDAVRIANATPYGLAGAVWSADRERARAIARRMRTGQVDINNAPYNPSAPFGGYKQSGIGRENGRLGLESFLEVKSIQE